MTTFRKLTASLVLLLGMAFCAGAQMYDVLDKVAADRRLQCGCECPYIFAEHARTSAPKGYKAFYLSHYGRHGSRYPWSKKMLDRIGTALKNADSLGCLTPRGKQFQDDFKQFIATADLNLGDLLPLGWEQHEKIAGNIYTEFKDVFRSNGNVNAMSSVTGRAIASMGAFCTGLQKMDRRLEISGRALHTDMSFTNPRYAPESIRPAEGEHLPHAGKEGGHDFFARMLDADEVLSVLFSDTAFIGSRRDRQDLLSQIYSLYQNYWAYHDKPFMEDLFTDEQKVKLWEVNNNYAYGMVRNPSMARELARDIVSRADSAVAGNGPAMDARFGHDTVVGYLSGLMDINDVVHPLDRADDVKYWFQDFNIPKAATLVFVFYRSRKSDTVLFKLLYNGKEATLPHLHPVSGPYYDFAELKSWAEAL